MQATCRRQKERAELIIDLSFLFYFHILGISDVTAVLTRHDASS